MSISTFVFFQSNKPDEGSFNATVLDVGQGLAVMIETKNHIMLYDAGPGYGSGGSAARFVVIPYLHSKGISKLDKLVISHDDIDHIGGVTDLIQDINIVEILGDELYFFDVIPASICHIDTDWSWDGVNFDILHPLQNNQFNGNNASCVLKIGNRRHSVLITGDIEYEAEDAIIELLSPELNSSILLAPHHGSVTSSK